MKKNFKKIFAAAAAFAIVLSCAKEENPVNTPQDGDVNQEVEMTPMTISATLSDVMTKVSFDPTYDGGKPQSLALAWEEDDQLRIYNHADKTQYADFELDPESVGQKTGRFTGTIFSAQSYDVEVISGDVAYASQTQPADGETSALKYLASATGLTDLSSVTFTEQSSVLALTAKLPEGAAAAVASVEITASEAIFSAGKTLTINLAQKGDAGNDGILNLFAHLPKGNQLIAEGTTLLVRFNAPETEHTVYTRFVELDAAAFTAGKLNTVNVNATESDTHAGLVSCDGTTAQKAYLIGDKYQLQAMSGLMNADATTYFKMVADVDLENAKWTSVNATSGVSFDGDNHKISNYTADGGLFSTLAGSVKNLAVDGATVSTKTNAPRGLLADNASGVDVKNITVTNSSLTAVDYIGGLIGVMNDGTIENVDFACPVKGGNTVGGFIGQMKDGSLKSISVTGKLTCTYQRTGGLVGYMEKGNVEDCSFTADLEFTNTASYANVGGMFGEIVEGTITGSYATGNVTAKKGDSVGGLVGVMKNGTIDGSYATGTVTVSENRAQHLGGLIGQVTGTVDVKDSYATGAVTGLGKNVGGLIGRLPNGTITNCYAEGNVSATNEQVGGLIGIVENGTITGCHATGTVTSSGMYGGALVGYMTKGSVTNSYATGSVTAGQESGGLIGCIGAVNVWKCYASGAVTVSGFHRVGGLIGSIAGNASVKESFATGTVGDDTKNNRGGLIGIILSGTVEISDCYTIPNMYSASYSGGFIGALDGSPGVKVRNSYTKPTFLSGNYGSKCVFSTSEVTDVIGFIGWSSVQRWRWNTADVPDGNYMGTEGTISAKAKDFKWDETIWDLSGDEPKLKWTLANN